MSDAAKRAAARAALEEIADGMVLGLGTGSTVAPLLELLAERAFDVVGVPTSEATARRCRELGIRLTSLDEVAALDLAIDGADEIDAHLCLTKGGGGALLREKVVACAARRFVVIATVDKQVERLGVSFPLPLEVVPFASAPVQRRLESWGLEVQPREREGRPVVTDNGNVLLDAVIPGGVGDPERFDARLQAIPGLVETGLFVNLAHETLLGAADGTVLRRRRPD